MAVSILPDFSGVRDWWESLDDKLFGTSDIQKDIRNRISGSFTGAVSDVTHGAVDAIVNPLIETLTGGRYENLADAFDVWTGEKANQDNLAYQREYNEQVFNRADTQYQRTVADLRAAGLSSQLAAGSPSTVAGASQAPQRTVGNESAAIERLVGIVNAIKSTNASTKVAEAQAENLGVDAAIKAKELEGFDEYRGMELAVMGSSVALNNAYTQATMIDNQTRAWKNFVSIQKEIVDTAYTNKLIEVADKNMSVSDSQIALNNALRAKAIKENLSLDFQNRYMQSMTNYNLAKIREVNATVKVLGQQLTNEVLRGEYISAETRNVYANMANNMLRFVIDSYDYNYKKDRGDAPSSTEVSSSQSAEELKKFKRQLLLTGVSSLTGVITGAAAGFGTALGLGGGKFFNKLRGINTTTLDPTDFIR